MSTKVSIVVVTHNRPEYLKKLLKSIQDMTILPENVTVVDNASDAETADVIRRVQNSNPSLTIVHHRLETNIGGSGGFSAGVNRALTEGIEWLWLMDDDVEVLPDGLAVMLDWAHKFQCFHGRRYNFDGSPFHFQPRINNWLAVPLPVIGDPFKGNSFLLTNCGCFEGMFIHRDVIAKIGPPDPRFYLTWDDAVYGWLASKITDVAIVNSFVLKRMRPQRQIDLGIRHLNDANDLSRYYVMRNRGLLAWYFRRFGTYSPAGFCIGTLLVLLKEMFRLIAVEKTARGFGPLIRGTIDGMKIAVDEGWAPNLPDIGKPHETPH